MAERPYRIRPSDPVAAQELARACGIGETLAQLLLHRGISTAAHASRFLDPKLSGLTSPETMADRTVAALRLARAVRARENIVVFGDYDVDGVTSASVLADALEALGGDVRAFVADRFLGGYGFGDHAFACCSEAGAQLIVTCDCGSSDHESIERARRAGIDVIVVDHHRVPPEPLPALAFLNPHRSECGFEYKGLASVGLVLSLAAAVRAELGANLDLRSWLDLVALGTVADMAPLDGDNRRLVRAGLRALGALSVRPGVAELRTMAGVRPGACVSASDIAFRLAPRLNAPGRLGNAQLALRLLRSRSAEEARGLAAQVEQSNAERKRLCAEVLAAAERQILEAYGTEAPRSLVVAGQGWHRGVVGIVAAQLSERFAAPTLAVALDGAAGHGSGRAPEGFPLFDAVNRCGSLFTRFGGHASAVGFSIRSAEVESLRAQFDDAVRCAAVATFGPRPEPVVDVEIDGNAFRLPKASELLQLEPLGEGNRAPLFALTDVEVCARKTVGQGHLALSLRLGSKPFRAFGPGLEAWGQGLPDRPTLVGQLRPDTWRGGESVELLLQPLPLQTKPFH